MNLAQIISRVREVLSDPGSLRFSDASLEEGIRQAMQEINHSLPQIMESSVTLETCSREQAFPSLVKPLYILSIRCNTSHGEVDLEPEVGFYYRMNGDQPMVHFTGPHAPTVGDTLTISYAACHSLSGLDGEITTSLPEGLASALVNGAAGQACLLRVQTLHGTTGTKPGEIGQLLQIAQLRLDLFQKNLADQKVFQEFGFPPGFRLDRWDAPGEVI
jgi:hypothetical protein